MKVLLTGHHGFIGSVLVPRLIAAGHEVVGLDTFYYEGCDFGPDASAIACIRRDLRDVTSDDLAGFDAVMHLAALSNDPVGDLSPSCTYAINLDASVHLAQVAKRAGVGRFLFSSSCSLYGVAGDEFLTEDAGFNPITAYGESKVRVEQALASLADATFSPTYLRNATAYGVSPRLRSDLVVNNLVGHAHLTGDVLIKSDGTPWRPLVHVQDISAAFIAVLEAPRDAVHNQAFNVGRTDQNYRVREVAEMVEELVPGSKVRYAEGAGPDPRCYRVACDKLPKHVPAFRPTWTVRRGIEELAEAYRRCGLRADDFEGERYVRLRRVRGLMTRGKLDADLRWV